MPRIGCVRQNGVHVVRIGAIIDQKDGEIEVGGVSDVIRLSGVAVALPGTARERLASDGTPENTSLYEHKSGIQVTSISVF